jgi:LAO/AO transport system kinase
MLDALIDAFQRGDRRALSRLLSLAARCELGESFLEKLKPPSQPSRVVALTGAAGVGKSTLAGRIIEYLRKQNQKVGVLASDPQSPLSGGALLGDRFRMPSGPDDGVFIRSLAAASGQGAIAKNLQTMIGILESFGFSNILVETVGAGQGDTAVRDVADVVVLLLQPESGDEIQGEKAGLLEVADIIAIHKADLPAVEKAEAELRHGLEVAMDRNVPILRVSGKTGAGIEQLWKAISERPLRRSGQRRDAGALLRLAQETIAFRFHQGKSDPAFVRILDEWAVGKASTEEALVRLWSILELQKRK